MEARFKQVNITDFTFSDGVSISDPRISQVADPHTQKCHSCMFGHLDMIRDFLYNTADLYAIFCEDDILIAVDFVEKCRLVMKDFDALKLDVLLLGCLIPTVIEGHTHNGYLAHILGAFKYFDYPREIVWGTQMYMISRAYARQIINNYGNGPECTEPGLPFSADWTITQHGNKRFVYPMLAIEDGLSNYEHYGQAMFHKASHSNHLHEANYV